MFCIIWCRFSFAFGELAYKNAITTTPNLVGKTLSSGCGTTKVIYTALLSLYILLLCAQLYHYYGCWFLKRMLSSLRWALSLPLPYLRWGLLCCKLLSREHQIGYTDIITLYILAYIFYTALAAALLHTRS